MALGTILTRIKELVGGVATIGASRVHIGERHFRSLDVALSASQDTGFAVPFVHIWFVTINGTDEIPFTTNSNLHTYQVAVECYYSVFDATGSDNPAATVPGTEQISETLFLTNIDSVCDALRNDGQLHGAIAINCSPPLLTAFDVREFAETECHYAEITMEISEEKLISYGV